MTALSSSHPKDDLKDDQNADLSLPTAISPSHEPPPSYAASTNVPMILPQLQQLTPSPTLCLSFTTLPLPPHPITMHMTGSSRSPDFTLTLPNTPTPLLTIDTDSTLIYHHSHIHDHRPSGTMHTLKRTIISGPGVDAPRTMVRGIRGSKAKTTPSKSGSDDGEWRYTIHGAGREGKKLLEVSTTAALLEGGKETRLVFRRGDDGELDALRLHTSLGAKGKGKGKEARSLQMPVTYQGGRVGEIVLLGSSEKPEFRIEVEVAGVDPLLLVVLALVVDDRWMGEKRRFRQEFGRGWTGVGKGPGAGLAAAFAL